MESFLSKINKKKVVADDLPGQKGIYYDDAEIWKTLPPVLSDLRVILMRVTKKLEKNPEMKKELKTQYGTGFINDLKTVAEFYAALK